LFGVVKATEIRRGKERDWSFSQFVGFSEKVQIMQDKIYRVLAALMGLVWFCTPLVLESVFAGLVENPIFPEHFWFWTKFVFWPFPCLCCHNAFVDAKRRVGGWTFMFVHPLHLLAVVVIGILLIPILSGFGIL
jgi:hypothetical protein